MKHGLIAIFICFIKQEVSVVSDAKQTATCVTGSNVEIFAIGRCVSIHIHEQIAVQERFNVYFCELQDVLSTVMQSSQTAFFSIILSLFTPDKSSKFLDARQKEVAGNTFLYLWGKIGKSTSFI